MAAIFHWISTDSIGSLPSISG